MLLPADAAVARRDPALPGLAVVLDPDIFAEAVGAPMALRPVYVRYKPGTSCLVAYRLGGEETGVQVVATCYRPDARAKLNKTRQRPTVPGPWGPGRLVLDRPAVAVSFFPNDDELEVLPRMADAAERGRLLRKMFPKRPELWSAAVRPLAYKPSRRFVAALWTGDGPQAVLKAYTGPGFEAARGTVRGARPGHVLRVARRLVGRSTRHRLLAWDWLPGRLLSEELSSPGFAPASVGPVGAALAELHAQKPGRLPPRTREREVAALHAAAAWIAAVCPVLGRRARGLAARLAQLLWERPEVRCPVHGDFYAKQVLLGDDGVSVLDFDEAGAGDPALDLGLFLAHLERGALRGAILAERVGLVRAALLDGYRAQAGAVPDGVDLYTAAGLLQLSPHSFRNRDPDWPDRTAARLDRAEAIARDLAPAVPARSGPDVPVTDPFGVADDPRMPFQAGALDPVEAERRLQGCWPGARLRAIRVTRYKPGRRCLIEYDLEDGGGPVTLVGKIRAKGADRTADGVLRALRAAGLREDGPVGVCVPEPVGVVAEFRMTLQRKAPGIPAGLLLLADDGPALACRVAEAAHRLHAAGVSSPQSHTPDDELRILHERFAALGGERPGWTARLNRLLAGCERLADRLPIAEPRGIHRDFYPDQVLADGPRLYLLDFDLYCLGDPAMDAGNFLGHLTELSLRTFGRPDGLRDREQSLEERFLHLAGARRRASVQAYATLTLVRHVSISTQFPDRRAFTEHILELCEKRLADAGLLPPARDSVAIAAAPGGYLLGGQT